MHDLRTLLDPLDREAARTGVGYGLPEWLVYHEGEDGGFWTADTGDYAIDEADQDGEEWKAAPPMDDRMQEVSSILPDDAARMIAEAGMWRFVRDRCMHHDWETLWFNDSPLLADLIAATLVVYATLPDAAKGGK